VIFGVLVWLGLYFRDARIRRLVPLREIARVPVLLLAALLFAGCASGGRSGGGEASGGGGTRNTVISSIGNRRIEAHSTGQHLSMEAFDDHSVLDIHGMTININDSAVTWGEGKSIPLPEGWRRMNFRNAGNETRVDVDGKTIGIISAGS
jgi:hypothetical protein